MSATTLQPAVETEELVTALRRMVTALSKRIIHDGDLDALAEMRSLAHHLDEKTTEAVAGLRHHPIYPASWQEVAVGLGVTKRAVRKRYGHLGGRREPGGQPGNLL